MRYMRLVDLLSVCLLVGVAPDSISVKAVVAPVEEHTLAARTDAEAREGVRVGQLHTRAPNAWWSFYNVEVGIPGSCGTFMRNSDFVVAMNAAQMNSSLCFKPIIMTYQGKSAIATIEDTCPGCPLNGLDLTEALFEFFTGSLASGIVFGDWEFADA